MDVRDSYNVPLANYQFVTDHGGLLDAGTTALWTIISMEFAGYIVIVMTAIWLIGYALSFQWLNIFATALRGVAHTLSFQIATPALLIVAATIGAFCVAWFVLRGFHAKATLQVVTMLGVAVIGPIFLSDPLADVLSPDGILSQGRDVGLTVAAGLDGDSNPSPTHLVVSIQHDMADNFARRPLQLWNLGHEVDTTPACRDAWSTGVVTGNRKSMETMLKNCGDDSAAAKVAEPSVGQVATGLMLLICGTLLLMFAAFLAFRVIKSALDSIYHALLAIFGFAAGGFVYGAPQTFLVRNVVHSMMSAARMTVFVIFLGLYTLVIGSLFKQVPGHEMAVMVTVSIFQTGAVLHVKDVNSGITKGGDWFANRFAVAIQSGMSTSSAGGGSALGMGAAGAKGHGLVARLGTVNTINQSPVTAWLAGGVPNPLSPMARKRAKVERQNLAVAPMNNEAARWNQLARDNARIKVGTTGRPRRRTALELATMIDKLGDEKVPESQWIPMMVEAGATPTQASQTMRAHAVQKAMLIDGYGVPAIQKAIAAAYAIDNHLDHDPATREAIAAKSVIGANNAKTSSLKPNRALSPAEREYAKKFMALPEDKMRKEVESKIWKTKSKDLKWYIGSSMTKSHADLTTQYEKTFSDPKMRGTAQEEIERGLVRQSARKMAAAGDDPWKP
ncbi:hypothetical protein GCM10027262_77020 [Nocardia tengchongensis]